MALASSMSLLRIPAWSRSPLGSLGGGGGTSSSETPPVAAQDLL